MNSYLNIRLTGNAFISTLLMKFAGQGTGCRLNSAYLLLFSLRKPQTAYFKIDRDLVKKMNAMISQKLRHELET